MKPATLTLTVAVLMTLAMPAAVASMASEREYQRGYNDCSQGRYDQKQHGESYKQGCRAAEDGTHPNCRRAVRRLAWARTLRGQPS